MKNRYLAALAALTALTLTGCGDHTDKTPKTAHSATTAAPAEPVEETTQAPEYDEITPDDFEITLKTTERHCFGSAGCNVTVQPDLTYQGLFEMVDPDKSYDITYTIHGDESGPVIETATLSDRKSLRYNSSVLSTASASTDITVEITDVEESY